MVQSSQSDCTGLGQWEMRIRSLAQELPHAVGGPLKKKERKRKEKNLIENGQNFNRRLTKDNVQRHLSTWEDARIHH